jgi:hypothetical protein
MQIRLAAALPEDFKLAPADTVADACTECLGSRFFRGKASGEALSVVLLAHAISDLARRIDAFEERLPEALITALNAFDLDKVGADADDQRQISLGSSEKP